MLTQAFQTPHFHPEAVSCPPQCLQQWARPSQPGTYRFECQPQKVPSCQNARQKEGNSSSIQDRTFSRSSCHSKLPKLIGYESSLLEGARAGIFPLEAANRRPLGSLRFGKGRPRIFVTSRRSCSCNKVGSETRDRVAKAFSELQIIAHCTSLFKETAKCR